MSGIRVIRPSERSRSSTQTSGMVRESGVAPDTTGSQTIWSGVVTTPPGVASGVHHHGDCESAIYVVRGRARFRFGPTLEHVVDVGPGDFLFVPPNEVHSEENLSQTDDFEMVVSRGCSTAVTVNVPDPRGS
ncbi:MAG: cupin domain-containing protein [Chloroflexota bacterium]